MMSACCSRSGVTSQRGSRRPSGSIGPGEQGNWIAGIDPPEGEPTKRVLYNQPRLVTANVVAVCEGEKDADNVAQCGLWAERTTLRLATTCNFDGAWRPGEKSKWLTEYNPYFTGKFVLIFPDNDENGETWAQAVAQNIHSYAHTVKIVRLPGLPAKGDVSDWLVNHTAKELEAEITKASELEADHHRAALLDVSGCCSICGRSRSDSRLASRRRHPSRGQWDYRRSSEGSEELQFSRPRHGRKLRRSMDGLENSEANQDSHRKPRG